MTLVSTSPSTTMEHCMICHECDLLVDIGALREGFRAQCPRCLSTLSNAYPNANSRIMVFSLTALICLIMSMLFDFVELSAAGQVRNITLFATAQELFELNEWALAGFTAVIIIGLPMLFISTLGFLMLQLLGGFASIASFRILQIIGYLRFWNMAEIFFLGILISMVKVAGMAHINIGPSFWFYAGFNFCMILALYHVDKFQLAQDIRLQLKASGKTTEGNHDFA